jgi:DNA modification methylase
LRDYGTAKWEGGSKECNHEVDSQNAAMKQRKSTLGPNKGGLNPDNSHFKAIGEVYRDICKKCGAVRIDNQIGLEKIPDCGAWNRGKFEQFIDYDDDKIPFISLKRTDHIVTCRNCYVCKIVGVFREVKRVLRDDGTLWLNLGDSYCGYKGENYCKNPETSNLQSNNHIPVANECGTPQTSGLKPKDLVGIPWRVAFALQADGWYLRSDIIWSKPNPMPEPVTDRPTKAHEYVFLLTKKAKYYYDADAVREAHKTIEQESKRSNFNDVVQYNEKAPDQVGKSRSGRSRAEDFNPAGRNRRTVWEITTQPTPEAHFATFPEALVEPCIKAGTSERGCCPVCGAGWERIVKKESPPMEVYTKTNVKEDEGDFIYKARKDGIKVGYGQKYQNWRNENPAQTTGWQPTCTCGELLTTKPCVVLDPFAGSGTTGLVARNLNRDAILIELNKEYVKIMKKKLRLNEQLVM